MKNKFIPIITALMVSLLIIIVYNASSLHDETNKDSETSDSHYLTKELHNSNLNDIAIPPLPSPPKACHDTIIDSIISSMSTEELVGQLFFTAPYTTGGEDIIFKYHVGGFVLFADHFKSLSKEQITSKITGYQSSSGIPLLIGVDEEGGSVVRVSLNKALRENPFPSPRDVFRKGGWDAIVSDANEKADLLLSLGINVNLSPVCDLSDDPNDFIYLRSFSGDAENTSDFIEKYVTASRSKKIGTVMKHFPGYGDNVDTHTGLARDDRPYLEFVQSDFLPFISGINSGADCIMVSHNIVECMDPYYPASLSESVHSVIREQLGFNGVIMTDDLSMKAITLYTKGENAAVLAVKCGNDMLCTSNIEAEYPAVLSAVNSGEIPVEQVKASVRRILKWKYDLGILDANE